MEWMNTVVSLVHNDENRSENDVEEVIQEAEEILRCCIFKLLEKVIHQEVDNGQFDFSSLPEHITKELKAIREYLIKCKNSDDSSYVHHQIIAVMDSQLDCTLKRHHQTFHKLTASLDLSSEFNFAYESFVRIAKRFIDGEITWFRVVSLLCFGAELSVAVIKKGGPGVQGFIKRIVHYVTEFLLKEEVADWISTHGGWMTMVNFFDSVDCPHRHDHLFDLIFITETTSFEKWVKRIAFGTVLLGIGYTISKRLS